MAAYGAWRALAIVLGAWRARYGAWRALACMGPGEPSPLGPRRLRLDRARPLLWGLASPRHEFAITFVTARFWLPRFAYHSFDHVVFVDGVAPHFPAGR